MATIDRRAFLTASGAIAGSALLPDAEALATGLAPPSYDDAVAVLYDATKCIGCRSCMRACREVNDLPVDDGQLDGVKFDMPEKLSEDNWMVLQAYRQEKQAAGEGGAEPEWSYLKRNCMHCNVPACASACPVAALQKTHYGAVTYDEDRCIGCRYCLLACPYHVPRYEWVDRMPRVRKCNWNRECVKACPVGALIEGKRKDLLAEAHRRIGEDADRYVDHLYGEHEAGGASYLILAGVEHEKLGLPPLPPTVRSSYADTLMRGLPGWVIGLALFLGGLYRMEKRQSRVEVESASAEDAASQELQR